MLVGVSLLATVGPRTNVEDDYMMSSSNASWVLDTLSFSELLWHELAKVLSWQDQHRLEVSSLL